MIFFLMAIYVIMKKLAEAGNASRVFNTGWEACLSLTETNDELGESAQDPGGTSIGCQDDGTCNCYCYNDKWLIINDE